MDGRGAGAGSEGRQVRAFTYGRNRREGLGADLAAPCMGLASVGGGGGGGGVAKEGTAAENLVSDSDATGSQGGIAGGGRGGGHTKASMEIHSGFGAGFGAACCAFASASLEGTGLVVFCCFGLLLSVKHCPACPPPLRLPGKFVGQHWQGTVSRRACC